jgi:predicted ATPase/class 3 adenylate cyclase
MPEQPTGTVTFLFTDIEGSTRLWQEHPDAMRGALARHDELIRDAIEGRGGYVVKTTGDGFHAAFGDPAVAVGAAIDAQRALLAEPWGLPQPIQVRMGVHTGAVESREGDYYGPAVNKAARLMGAAHGGQIVLSHATEQLLAPEQVELVDLGVHALRDLSHPERVFQVGHPDLARDFPSLASMDVFEGNLPVQGSTFVGRESDLARVLSLLDDARMVTLVGTGGVGKTRLAVQVAAEAAPRFPDGAWFCELAAAEDADGMVQVVASTLGCVQHPGLSLSSSVVQYLKTRALLLVLDNCEHLLQPAAEFAHAILRGCPRVTLVATSREALDLVSERVVRVPSLATPEDLSSRVELQQVASVQLFCDRARDAGSDLDWTESQWAAAGEICQRVDGIPLAIELAAARTVAMSPMDIARHLDERFRLLTGKRHAMVERHRTLRATVEWSYQLLDRDTQDVFARLGTFTGGFDERGAIAVAGDQDHDAWSVMDAVASLVAKSMLVRDTGPDGASRYSMLETLRQFALEALEASDETDRLRSKHARHYAEFAHGTAPALLGRDHSPALTRLRSERDNLRSAIAWALDRDDPRDQELGLMALADLSWAGDMYPDLGVGVLASRAVPSIAEFPPELCAPVLALAAVRHWHQGEIDAARVLGARAVEYGLVTSTINPLTPFVSLVTIEMSAGNAARAFEIAEVTRSYLEGNQNDFDTSRFLSGLATFESMAGLLEVADSDSNRALQIAQQSGNQYLLAAALSARAWVLQHHDPESALAAAEQMLEIHRRSGVARSIVSVGIALAAGLRARLGDDHGAFPLFRDALVMARDDGTLPQTTAVLSFALNPLCRTGRADVAATFIGVLDQGALAHVAGFPGTAASRARTLARIENSMSQEALDELLDTGASMTYDEMISYAIEQFAATSV